MPALSSSLVLTKPRIKRAPIPQPLQKWLRMPLPRVADRLRARIRYQLGR